MLRVNVFYGIHDVTEEGVLSLNLADSAERAVTRVVRHGHRVFPGDEQWLLILDDGLDFEPIYDDLRFLLLFLKYQLL